MNAPPKPPPTRSKPTLPKPNAASPLGSHVPKTFGVKAWTDAGEGSKVVVYSRSGMGKTTLGAMAPNAIFIGIDDGGRKIRHPKTGEPIGAVADVRTFQDLRDALHQGGLFPNGSTIVIDTVTKAEEMIQTHVMETMPINGKHVSSFRKYGWDGERHLLDQYRLLLSDLDPLVRAGLNVVLLAQLSQITVANAEGIDYLEDGPKLQHRKDCSVRTEVCEWADHVFRIGYLEFDVQKENAKDRTGKVQTGDATRAIFTGGAAHYFAKTRPVNGEKLPPVISFANEQDDALWQFVFPPVE